MHTARQCLVVEQTNRGDRAACPVRFRTRRKRTFIDEIDKIIREENNIMGKRTNPPWSTVRCPLDALG